MKAYYETVIRTSKGKTTPIAYIGEWDGEKFIGTNESGFEIIVRKKEWVTIVNETQEQDIEIEKGLKLEAYDEERRLRQEIKELREFAEHMNRKIAKAVEQNAVYAIETEDIGLLEQALKIKK